MPDEPLELGEIAPSDYHVHHTTMAGAGFLAIARRLSSLIVQAFGMAWEAGPRDTVTTVLLNLLGGIVTAFGLPATTDLLNALFSQGPITDRVLTALPTPALSRSAIQFSAVSSASA
jgi:ATP-binding cassette subfamily B protein